jgi:hypothetical protein
MESAYCKNSKATGLGWEDVLFLELEPFVRDFMVLLMVIDSEI